MFDADFNPHQDIQVRFGTTGEPLGETHC